MNQKELTIKDIIERHTEFNITKETEEYRGGSISRYTIENNPLFNGVGNNLFNEEICERQIEDSYGNFTGEYETLYVVDAKMKLMELSKHSDDPCTTQVTAYFEYNTTESNVRREGVAECEVGDDTPLSEVTEVIEEAMMDEIRYR